MRTLLLPLLALSLAACDDNKGTTTDQTTDTAGISNGPTDADGDGYASTEDCDDNDGTVNPGATEVCDGIDNDCDGSIDEDVTTTYYRDADGDGFGDAATSEEACEKPTGYVPNANDCDDTNIESYPGNNETCDGIDNDCDGEIDEDVTTTYYADTDLDGYGDPDNSVESCSQPTGYVTDNTDCDDTTAQSFPGNLEVCDELDNDCDGDVDEGVTTTYYADVDGDGYGDPSSTEDACALPTGYAEVAGDCDDTEPTTNPGATEYCDEVDNDCDGTTDEDDAADATDWYADRDADGYGDASISRHQCYQPTGFVADDTDCDDTTATTYPGADEYCNGADDDCDGTVDEDDAVDASDWYADVDGDGYGDASSSVHQCYQPTGYVSDDTDCDDTDDTAWPGADEYCDGVDNDCDGSIDEDGEVVDGDTFYADADTDGLGDADSTIVACDAPSGYVDNPYDCDDADASEPVVVDKASGSSAGAGTLSDPLDSIQDGVDRAAECVIVYAGTYSEQVDLGGTGIDVWGVEGADYTYIKGDGTVCDATAPTGCEPAVIVASDSGATPTLRGFTITGGGGYTTSSSTTTTCADSSASHAGSTTCTVNVYTYCGGGIYVEGDDPTFSDVVVVDNVLPEFEQTAVGSWTQNWLYSYGGGICVRGGNPVLEGVDIYENYADQGGGIYAEDSAVVTATQSVWAENTASDGAAVNLSGASLAATNIVVAFNDASTDGGGLFLDDAASASLVNVSMAYDTSASGSTRGDAIYFASGTSVELLNSILYGDASNDLVYGAGSWTSSYNDAYNAGSGGTLAGTATAGTGAISADPLWTRVTDDGNYYNDDWSLQASSPCVDAGDPSSAYDDADGTTNDMGATGGPAGDWDY